MKNVNMSPKTPIVYEPARPGEERTLEDFALQSNAYHNYRSVSEEEARKVFEISSDAFTKGVFLVAKAGEKKIGFLGILQIEKEGQTTRELHSLFIHPNFIGQGFGRLLFQRAMDEAKRLSWTEIEWESDPFAADFYRKMGAVEIKEKARTCLLNPKYTAPRFCFILTIQNAT